MADSENKSLLQKLVSLWSSVIDKTGGSTGNKWAVRTVTTFSGSLSIGNVGIENVAGDQINPAKEDGNLAILAGVVGNVETPSMEVFSSGTTIAAGAKSATIRTDSSFSGTILTATAEADSVYSWSASPGNTLGAIAITLTSGSFTVLKTV